MSWIKRLRNTLNPNRVDAELTEEIRDHIERRALDLGSQGIAEVEARRRASAAFGSVASIHEESREFRLWGVIDSTIRDIRYGWRGLLRNPAFAAVAVISLSLAIGSNTAIYSLIDAVLLRPLPVALPDRLVSLTTSEDAAGADVFSYPLYETLARAAGGSARIALFDSPNRVEVRIGAADSEYEEALRQYVSPDAFEILGVRPALGRLFSTSRTDVVLSHEYWTRRFGADPGVLGRALFVPGRTLTVAGVAAAGFTGAEPGKFVDVWLPIGLTDPGIFTNADFRAFRLLGRLGPGATLTQLEARLQPAFHNHQLDRIAHGTPGPRAIQDQLRQLKLIVLPGASGTSSFQRDFSRPLWILLAVAISILVIACANVASLLLARSTVRAGEMALRISLGARRARLIRQLLTESLILSLLAGLGGWMLSRVAAPALVAMVSKQYDPVRLDLAADLRVILFLIAVCSLSALFFGLLPAWRAIDAKPMLDLRRTHVRAGRVFVGIQVAFAFCLIAGGAGFLFSLRNLTAINRGFDARGVTVLSVTGESNQHDRQMALMRDVETRTAQLPGVQGAAAAWNKVFSGSRRAQRVLVPGSGFSEKEETFYRVSPSYFATMRTPILSGRAFTAADNDNEPVPAVVNQTFARKYYGTDSVLGRRFQRDDGVWEQIVGVAADSLYTDLRHGPEAIVYMPMKPPVAFTLYVRSTLDAASVVRMVGQEAKIIGSGVRVRDSITLEALVGSTIAKERLLAAVGGVFALLGLVLAAIGLFGLLNYSVVRRTKEIGIRIALGAGRGSIYAGVLAESGATIVGGIAVGIAGALALMRTSQSILFGVGPADPMVMGTAIAVFAVVALIAGGLPARRAAHADPLVALRHE